MTFQLVFKASLLGLSAGFLMSCGGSSQSSSPTAPPPTTVTPPPAPSFASDLESEAEASAFLRMAGLGGTDAQITSATGLNAASWIKTEMDKPATLTLDTMLARFPTQDDTDHNHSNYIWKNLFEADDQLRQRMLFALSQIFVISDNNFFDGGYASAYYTDILTRNAFGNYRQLLEEITYSPAMASYLTYYRNRKGDPETGRMPDENYAREILQLFSIGLIELNMDGTPKLDANGQPIETYDNEDVIGLARVFTGLSADRESFWADGDDSFSYRPLKAFDTHHSELEKTFLGTSVPPNTSAVETIEQALDTIANHPNVAPFISRQLIQRFTSSSPSPAYVERVARVFEAGRFEAENGEVFGTGTRGDLGATLAAILLDPTQHDDIQDANEGKLREPVLKFVHAMRAFNASPYDVTAGTDWPLYDTNDPGERLGQHPLRSPSVFNFYRPGYIAPNSETGAQGLTAPELQIVNETSSLGFTNFMLIYVIWRSNDDDPAAPLKLDFEDEIALASDAQVLIDHLDVKLTGGQMSDETKADIVDAVGALNIDSNDVYWDSRRRVQLAVLMTLGSGAYAAQN